jgi:phosphohistidine phosphatase
VGTGFAIEFTLTRYVDAFSSRDRIPLRLKTLYAAAVRKSTVTMRRLMLLRHAKAVRAEPGAHDFDRALAPAGRDASPRIGAYMAGHALKPDLTICSPARRAKETWELAAGAYSTLPRTTYDQRIYGLSADGLLGLVRTTSTDVKLLLLVGHNPSLEDLAALLIAPGGPAARAGLGEKFPTGALAVIDVPIDQWNQLQPKSGHFDRLVTPKMLSAARE